ncbi:FAD-binding protein [Massilia sp. CCM 8695]|uniref:FAD-binding protein n=1 Tax=Massilia frigida TaxID=2609281 RepID=A0ABX0MZ45_9BURK|nr:NAD(P)/FAD-dependent oxidoreductase [Massilia frigida]NHZ78318.1 FAD-binding protein [Massilia frigida]
MDTDFIVVGGSFAGMAAAIQLARANRPVRVIDAGQPRNRFAAAAHGFLGHDGRAPRAIIDDARRQLLAYPSASVIDAMVDSAAPVDGGFEVVLAGGERMRGKRLILASGVVDQFPSISGVRERWGTSVLHCPYCHGYEFLGRQLAVIGVMPMSSHMAQLIAEWSPFVTYCANGIALDPEQEQVLRARGIRIEHSPVVALGGAAPALDGIILADGTLVPADAAFLATQVSTSPLARQLGCAFDEGPLGAYVRTDEFQETSVRGVFAAGDVARMWHNATWAAADGVSAGTAAHRSLVFA